MHEIRATIPQQCLPKVIRITRSVGIGQTTTSEVFVHGPNAKRIEDHGVRLEIAQQDIKWRLIERRVHGLQDEVVLFIGAAVTKSRPQGLRAQAVFQKFRRIRSPLAKVIIHVDDRNLGASRPFFQFLEVCGYWKGFLE